MKYGKVILAESPRVSLHKRERELLQFFVISLYEAAAKPPSYVECVRLACHYTASAFIRTNELTLHATHEPEALRADLYTAASVIRVNCTLNAIYTHRDVRTNRHSVTRGRST